MRKLLLSLLLLIPLTTQAIPKQKVSEYQYKNVIITFKDGEVLKGYFNDIVYEREMVYNDKRHQDERHDYRIRVDGFAETPDYDITVTGNIVEST